MNKILISKIINVGDSIIIKKTGEDNKFFISTTDSIIISTANFARILHFLVMSDIINYKTLEGILEDYKRE